MPRTSPTQRRLNHGTIKDCDSSPDANMEPDTGDAPMAANANAAFAGQVRVTFHHTRKRLADIDGLSGKAVLDGIVEAGILAGDSAEQVAEVRHRQHKGEREMTVVEIEQVTADMLP